MNKTVVFSTAVVVVVAVGGGTYAVLHTPKRQFESNLVKLTKSDDNIANFKVKASGTNDDVDRMSGTIKSDAKNENNLALRLKVTEKNKPAIMNIKMNGKHTYVSADIVTNSLQAYGVKNLTEVTKSLDKYWLDASQSASVEDTYSNVKPKEVRSDATAVTEWFKDLDGNKFKKVSDGYRVNLNKTDFKSLMTKISKTKSGKELSKSDWQEAKSAINSVKNLQFKVTVGDKGQSLAFDFSGKENNRKESLNFNMNTKRNDQLKVKMPAKSVIKTEDQLARLLQNKMLAYYSDQLESKIDDINSSSSAATDDILDA